MTGFFQSLVTKAGLISILFVICVIVLVVKISKEEAKLSARSAVAIGVGAGLYAAISLFSLPIGPNTSFRISIALLTIFGGIFGPTVGFLVGFIGHALNDVLVYGSVWWSWVFISAIMGLFAGFITFDKTFDVLKGKFGKVHIVKLYVYAAMSIFAASFVAYLGDVFLYGEPADRVWRQILIASASNFAVVAIVGIPALVAFAYINKANHKMDLE